MGLNHPKYNPVPIPYPNLLQSMEKLCSTKLVPGSKMVGDLCPRTLLPPDLVQGRCPPLRRPSLTSILKGDHPTKAISYFHPV